MAIQQYIAPEGCTLWDICLNTYGDPNLIVKLMKDNSIPNINAYPIKGQSFSFDDTLVLNQNQLQANLSNLKFATRERTSTNEANMIKYEQSLTTDYTSNADGTTVVTLPALIGSRIIQIEKEIQPLADANYTWNPSSGILTLLNGITVDSGQTLYIIYAVLITS